MRTAPWLGSTMASPCTPSGSVPACASRPADRRRRPRTSAPSTPPATRSRSAAGGSCCGRAAAARLAWRGRSSYWLAVLGAFFFLIGTLWGRGYLSGGATFTFGAAGIVLAVFGVALDLILGPPGGPAAAE